MTRCPQLTRVANYAIMSTQTMHVELLVDCYEAVRECVIHVFIRVSKHLLLMLLQTECQSKFGDAVGKFFIISDYFVTIFLLI